MYAAAAGKYAPPALTATTSEADDRVLRRAKK